MYNGHPLETETYIGGKVGAAPQRAPLPTRRTPLYTPKTAPARVPLNNFNLHGNEQSSSAFHQTRTPQIRQPPLPQTQTHTTNKGRGHRERGVPRGPASAVQVQARGVPGAGQTRTPAERSPLRARASAATTHSCSARPRRCFILHRPASTQTTMNWRVKDFNRSAVNLHLSHPTPTHARKHAQTLPPSPCLTTWTATWPTPSPTTPAGTWRTATTTRRCAFERVL